MASEKKLLGAPEEAFRSRGPARLDRDLCILVLSMHARPEIREILISKKLKRWALIAQFPGIHPTCHPSRARKNFWRLCARYPEIAKRLGLTAASLY